MILNGRLRGGDRNTTMYELKVNKNIIHYNVKTFKMRANLAWKKDIVTNAMIFSE